MFSHRKGISVACHSLRSLNWFFFKKWFQIISHRLIKVARSGFWVSTFSYECATKNNPIKNHHIFFLILILKIPCVRKLGRGPRNKGVYRYQPRLCRVQVWPSYSCNLVIVFFFLTFIVFKDRPPAPLPPNNTSSGLSRFTMCGKL